MNVGYSGGEEYLVPIAWEDDHVQCILRKVKKVIDSNEIGPERYIIDVYGPYEPLLQQPFSDSFDSTGEMTWRANEKVSAFIIVDGNHCLTSRL